MFAQGELYKLSSRRVEHVSACDYLELRNVKNQKRFELRLWKADSSLMTVGIILP